MVKGELKLDGLPADVLGRVLEYLGPGNLHRLEHTNRRLRRTVVEQRLWRRLCLSGCRNLRPLIVDIRCKLVGEELRARGCNPTPAQVRSAFFKRLCWRLGTPPNANANQATSIDPLAPSAVVGMQMQQQQQQQQEGAGGAVADAAVEGAAVAADADLVLGTVGHVAGPADLLHWRSTGSKDGHGTWQLDVHLKEQLVLMHALCVQPFRDHQQVLYAPYAVRARVGAIQAGVGDDDDDDEGGGPSASATTAAAAGVGPSGPSSSPPLVGHGGGAGGGWAAAEPGVAGASERGYGSVSGESSAEDGEAGVCGCPEAGASCGPSPLPWHWSSCAYPVAPTDDAQRFAVPPLLCPGGGVRLDVLGATAANPEDGMHYVLAGFRVVGVPLPDFRMEPAEEGSGGRGGGPGRGPTLAFIGSPHRARFSLPNAASASSGLVMGPPPALAAGSAESSCTQQQG